MARVVSWSIKPASDRHSIAHSRVPHTVEPIAKRVVQKSSSVILVPKVSSVCLSLTGDLLKDIDGETHSFSAGVGNVYSLLQVVVIYY